MKRTHSLLLCCLAATACRAVDESVPRSTPAPAWAEGERALSVRGLRLEPASGSTTDVSTTGIALGIAQNFRDGFALRGELELAGLAGADTTASGSAAAIGSLRWHALRGSRWSMFLELGLGVSLADEAFPTGGTSANLLRESGVGVFYELTDTLGVSVGLRQRHVSNGRGLVADNPSWEGVGGYLGLEFRMPSAAPARAVPTIEAPVEALPWSLRAEARAGEVEDATARGVALAFDGRMWGANFGQVRYAYDEFDAGALREVGGAVYRRGARGLLGLSFDRQSLDVFVDDELAMFGELYANDLVTVAAMLGHESRSHDPDRVIASVLFRIYPTSSLAVVTGVAGRDTLEEFGAASFDIPIGIEYAPAFVRRHGFSFYFEDDVNHEVRAVGLRWTLGPFDGEQSALRDRQRAAGPLRSRP